MLERKLDALILAAEASVNRADSLASLAAEHNSFAIALYGKLHDQPGNHFLSPLGVRTALAMAHAGARGETAAEMGRVLRISVPDGALPAPSTDLYPPVDASNSVAGAMTVANSLWSQSGMRLEPAFEDVIATKFGGSVNSANFRDDANAARTAINRWVKDCTAGKIPEFLPPGSPTADTRLVLINAVYFKAPWKSPFDKELTRDEPFYLEGGGEVRTPLMHQLERVHYLKGPDYQAVGLDYQGSDLTMLVLLPDQRGGLRTLESALSASTVNECLQSLGTRRVEVSLPRFTFSWGTFDIRGPLESMGMRKAFSRADADFSGMNGRAPPHEDSVFLSAVYHKAFVELNEEGTEAAAATGLDFFATGPAQPPPPTPVFRADHPFLFAICNRKRGTIAFLGRMVNPARGD